MFQKKTKLLILNIMTFIHQNQHYHVTCIQNWHCSKPTNCHPGRVIYTPQCPYASHKHKKKTKTIITYFIVTKYQYNTALLICKKKLLKATKLILESESRFSMISLERGQKQQQKQQLNKLACSFGKAEFVCEAHKLLLNFIIQPLTCLT